MHKHSPLGLQSQERRVTAIKADTAAQNQLNSSASQLTDGHNFFNASKLFMNEQGGAVVSPKPLWLEKE